jgi:RNA polymerase-binding protein DksA
LSRVKKILQTKQAELKERIANTQTTEREETKEARTDSAKLWEDSDIRDGLDDEVSNELEQVNQALRRLDSGEYGTCESCGKMIGSSRLVALPYAVLCIECAGRDQN